MKIQLEKTAVNISKLTVGKKAARGDFIWKTSVRFIFCLQGTLNGNQNNWTCDMSTSCFVIEILLHIYNIPQTEVISGFLFTFITHKLWEHLVGVFTVSWYIFKVLFNDYDVTTLKIIHPITFRNYTKHPIK